MSTEFHYMVKRLEGYIAGGMWERAEAELQSAYVSQPKNPYLNAFAQRIASLMVASEAAGSSNDRSV